MKAIEKHNGATTRHATTESSRTPGCTTQVRQCIPRPGEAKRSETLRASARSRVQLYEFGGGARSRGARGLLGQLRAAGWIPADVVIDENKRRALEWTDAQGRRNVLRPHATHQWEVRRVLLPHEIKEERARERKRVADQREADERARRVKILADQMRAFKESCTPTSASRSSVLTAPEDPGLAAAAEALSASPARFGIGEVAMFCYDDDERQLVEIIKGFGLHRVSNPEGAYVDRDGERSDYRFGYLVRALGEKESSFTTAHRLLNTDHSVRHLRLLEA